MKFYFTDLSKKNRNFARQIESAESFIWKEWLPTTGQFYFPNKKFRHEKVPSRWMDGILCLDSL